LKDSAINLDLSIEHIICRGCIYQIVGNVIAARAKFSNSSPVL